MKKSKTSKDSPGPVKEEPMETDEKEKDSRDCKNVESLNEEKIDGDKFSEPVKDASTTSTQKAKPVHSFFGKCFNPFPLKLFQTSLLCYFTLSNCIILANCQSVMP